MCFHVKRPPRHRACFLVLLLFMVDPKLNRDYFGTGTRAVKKTCFKLPIP